MEPKSSPERLCVFSDGVFAIMYLRPQAPFKST